MPNRTAARSTSSPGTPSSTSRTASSRYGNRMRFTRKPGLSATTTGTLPSLRTNSTRVATVPSSVPRPRTTSTRCMRWTGLKKCSPATRSGCGVPSASRVTDSAEVFDARTAEVAEPLRELAEDLPLHVLALDHGLDDHVGVGERPPLARRRDVSQGRVGRVARDRPLAHRLGREGLDLLHPVRDDLVADVLHRHGDAGERDELRDPRTHRPGPDHGDLADRRGRMVAPRPRSRACGRAPVGGRPRSGCGRSGVKTTRTNSSRSAANPAARESR